MTRLILALVLLGSLDASAQVASKTAKRLRGIPTASLPATCTTGDLVYDSTTKGVKECTSNSWTAVAPDNAIALGTDTTGNYALGDAEGGAATTGDSATSFFSAGTLEQARGGTGAGALTCSGGDFLTSNGSAYSCSTPSAAAATSLDTTGAAVDVSAAAPPVAGAVLRATSATTATWQTNTLSFPSRGYSTLDASATALVAYGNISAITTACTTPNASWLSNGHVAVSCTTGATSGNSTEYHSTAAVVKTGHNNDSTENNITAVSLLGINDVTAAERIWAIALTSATALDQNDTVAASSYCGIRYSTGASDTEWKCCTADGTTASCSTLGARTSGGTRVARRFEVQLKQAACTCRHIDGVTGEILSSVAKTTNLPAANTALYVYSSATTLQAVGLLSRIEYFGID